LKTAHAIERGYFEKIIRECNYDPNATIEYILSRKFKKLNLSDSGPIGEILLAYIPKKI